MRPAAGIPMHPEPGAEHRVWAAGGFPCRCTETSGDASPAWRERSLNVLLRADPLSRVSKNSDGTELRWALEGNVTHVLPSAQAESEELEAAAQSEPPEGSMTRCLGMLPTSGSVGGGTRASPCPSQRPQSCLRRGHSLGSSPVCPFHRAPPLPAFPAAREMTDRCQSKPGSC